MPKLLHLIVACGENRVIGRDRKLPWRIPEDLKYFHDQTAGQICVLGRICFETWPRAAADGRRAVVLSHHQNLSRENVFVVPSLDAALARAETLPGEIYVCGGEKIYAETLALQRPMRLHLTLIHASFRGDTFFPDWHAFTWREIDRRESADENYRYTFLTLDRVL